MKEWLSKKSNLVTLSILIIVLILKAPLWLSNAEKEGTAIAPEAYAVLGGSSSEPSITFPDLKMRSLVIFWASWCGPCKIEMARLKKSVESGNISKDKIFAVNPFEAIYEIKKFMAENNYPFTFIDAPELGKKLQIEATPTTLFLDGNRIHTLTTGLSFIGIWRAEIFLSE